VLHTGLCSPRPALRRYRDSRCPAATVYTHHLHTAFLHATGAAHWEVLLRARAIECQSYVIAAAQAGVHNEKRESYGHSLIVDPWGVVVARLDDPHATGVLSVGVDALCGLQQQARPELSTMDVRHT
jgi:predicted amidohydrolase